MREAFFYKYIPETDKIFCKLCPKNCFFDKENKTGDCGNYIRKKNKLYSRNYNNVVSLSADPVEKKPLYHFFPGKNIVSVGFSGCNMHCNFCQNHEISQNYIEGEKITPEELIKKVKSVPGNIGLAYTYNEPFINFEYVYECSELCRKEGLKNVYVTNGMINEAPLEKILPFTDAFNVDLKSADESFYKTQCQGMLAPVKETIKQIYSARKHIEITFLLIPGKNSNIKKFKEMIGWISDISENIPLHISRYFPQYKADSPPTSEEELKKFILTASQKLNYVYPGNSVQESSTKCPECGNLIIERNFYNIKRKDLEGRCSKCKRKIF
ncbi:MAG: AmmeMemoRadiSam system radical SAM enzyme [Candidatus Muiribacteriota bacterium]